MQKTILTDSIGYPVNEWMNEWMNCLFVSLAKPGFFLVLRSTKMLDCDVTMHVVWKLTREPLRLSKRERVLPWYMGRGLKMEKSSQLRWILNRVMVAQMAEHELKVVGLNPASGSYETMTLSVTCIDGYVTSFSSKSYYSNSGIDLKFLE